jgi:hypothetical protein
MSEIRNTTSVNNPNFQENSDATEKNGAAVKPNKITGNSFQIFTTNARTAISGQSYSTPNTAYSQAITLERPRLDPDTAAIMIAGTLENAGNISIKVSTNTLTTAIRLSEALNKEKIRKYDQNIKKTAELAAKNKEKQVASDVGLGFSTAAAIAGMIGAIFLTIFTAGGGAAAIVAAAIGLTTALMDVTDRIMQAQNNGQGVKFKALDGTDKNIEFSFAGMVKRATEQIIHDNKVNNSANPLVPKGLTKAEEEAFISKWVMGWTITVNLLVAGAAIAAGAVSLNGVAKGAKTVADNGKRLSEAISVQTAKLVAAVAESIQMINEVGGACSMIANGAYGVQLAYISFDQKELDIMKDSMDAWSKVLSGEISSNQDYISSVMEKIEESFENLATLLSNFYQSQSKIVNPN